jgi:FkbM family methyltransferase
MTLTMNPEVVSLLTAAAPEIYNEVCEQDVYQVRAYRQLLEPLRLNAVLDLGGNVGCFAALAAELWPDTPVYSVEPHEPNLRILRQVATHYPNVQVLPWAIGRQAVTRAGHLDEITPACCYYAGALDAPAGPETVTLAELSDRLALQPPYIVKLDIEGAETCLYDDPRSTEVLRHAVMWAAELHLYDPGIEGSRIHASDPATYLQHNGSTVQRALLWLYGFSDLQAVVLNMSQPTLWGVVARALRHAPWS